MARANFRRWQPTSPRGYSRRLLLGSASAGAGLAVVLSACQSRSPSKATYSSSTGQQGKPTSGGQFNVPTLTEPTRFDPIIGSKTITSVLIMTNNNLVSFKAGPGVKYTDLVLQPDLAERWETPDPQTYVFHLHPDVKFANLPPVNGRALTATDVNWTLEYLSRTGSFVNKKFAPSGLASFFSGLDRIDTPDPATVVVHFQQPFAPFLNYAATHFVSVLAHEIFDQDGDFSKQAVGSGPWQLDKGATQPGQHWTFKKNPTYFVQGRPYIDQINWVVLPDPTTAEAALVTKQADILDYMSLTPDTATRLQKQVPSLVVYQDLDYAGHHIYMNVSKAPLSDERVRKAFALCINRDEFIKTFSNGKGQWALAGANPGIFTEEETKQILVHDPAQAKQLMTAAGYPNGVDIEFFYNTDSYGEIWASKVQLIQSQVKQAGINLKLRLGDATEGDDLRRSGNFQLTMTSGPPGFQVDPDNALYPLFYPGSTGNRGRVDDPVLTPLLEAQRRELDPTKRRDIIRQAVRRINDVPDALALYYGTVYQLWQPRLKNYAPNMGNDGRKVVDSWLEK